MERWTPGTLRNKPAKNAFLWGFKKAKGSTLTLFRCPVRAVIRVCNGCAQTALEVPVRFFVEMTRVTPPKTGNSFTFPISILKHRFQYMCLFPAKKLPLFCFLSCPGGFHRVQRCWYLLVSIVCHSARLSSGDIMTMEGRDMKKVCGGEKQNVFPHFCWISKILCVA